MSGHQDNSHYDIVIVGAGIVGAAIAYFTAPACRVLLLEAESAPGYHSTGRSAALFTEAYGPPSVRALTRASRPFFDAPPPGFASTPLLKPRGTLFPGSAAQEPELQALYASLRDEGSAARLLSGSEARAMVPVLRPEAAVLAVYDAAAFDVDVHALLQGYLRGAKKQGATLLNAASVQSLERADRTWRVLTGDGRGYSADRIVNAAGAWADQLAATAGVQGIGLEPRRRSAFLFAPPADVDSADWPAVIAIDESWYFKPDAGLLLGSPANADPVRPHDVVAEELDVMLGIHNIESATTLNIHRPKSSWAGLRCFVEDGEPVCGFDAEAPGFFWAAALGGYGIQSSPGFGRLCASLLLDQGVPADIARQGLRLDLLQPQRPALNRGKATTS